MNRNMMDDVECVLISEEEIQQKVKELGAQISRDYADKNLFMLSVLKGSVLFMADLMRAITVPTEIDFMCVSSYGNGTQSSGQVQIIKDVTANLEGKDILIVEDILDSGLTLSYLQKLLQARHPASMKLCALLDKPDRRKTEVHVDYSGFVIPDKYVIGYGVDYAEKYRNLPFIGTLKPEICSK